MTRIALTVLLAVALASPLAACGRKGKPHPPAKQETEAPATSG